MNNKIITSVCLGIALLSSASCTREYPYQVVTPIDTPASLSIVIEDLDGEVSLMAPKTRTYTIKAEAKAIADELITMTVTVDPALVEEYNNANGTSYAAAPAEAYEISNHTLYLPRYNKTSSTSQIILKSDGLPEDGNAYLLPVTISELKCESTEFDMSAEDYTKYILFRRKMLPPSGFEYGTGTESDPYLINNQTELICMPKGIKEGKPTYFRLEADIDMSDYEDWVPVSPAVANEIHFDGNNKTITGFNCSSDINNSMLGVFVGSFRNLTFVNPILTSGNVSPTGLVASSIGDAANTDRKTVVSNVTVKGLKIKSTASNGKGNMIGGIAGNAINAEFSNIDVEIELIDADENNSMSSQVGGVVGTCLTVPSTFTKCTTKGTLLGHHSTGGILGYASAEGVKIIECSSSVNISSFGNNTGGILGYGKANTEITDCTASGNITGGGTFTGGLIGQIYGSTITHCSATGRVIGKGHYAGGLIGGGEQGGLTVKRCFASGDVNTISGKNHCGGLIGNMDTKGETGGSLIEDCYASGNVIAEGNARMYGGFIGVIEKSNNDVVRRCFCSGDVVLGSTTVTCGGMIGIAKTGSSGNDALTLNINFTLEKCIAWNKKVINGNNPGSWSGGAIIGATSATNTLKDNYRRADMEFVDYGGVTLSDQDNVSPSSPLQGTNASTYKFAYHGKAAASGASLSSVAKSLSWPTDIWDLSGDTPKLK